MDLCCPQLDLSQINAELAGFLSANSDVVYREIFMIQSKILDYVNSCEPCKTNCILIDNGTPFTYYPYIESISVLEGGQNYFPLTAVATVMSNTGYDAEIELTIVDGVITEANVINGGTGYSVIDTVIVSHPSGINANLSASFTGGVVTGITVIDGGENYYPQFPVIELLYAGGGYGALVTPSINVLTGSIDSIEVNDGGMFYSQETTANVVNAVDQSGDGAYLKVSIPEIPMEGIDNTKYYNFVATDINECYAKEHIDAVLMFFRNRGFKISVEINEKTLSTITWKVCWC